MTNPYIFRVEQLNSHMIRGASSILRTSRLWKNTAVRGLVHLNVKSGHIARRKHGHIVIYMELRKHVPTTPFINTGTFYTSAHITSHTKTILLSLYCLIPSKGRSHDCIDAICFVIQNMEHCNICVWLLSAFVWKWLLYPGHLDTVPYWPVWSLDLKRWKPDQYRRRRLWAHLIV